MERATTGNFPTPKQKTRICRHDKAQQCLGSKSNFWIYLGVEQKVQLKKKLKKKLKRDV